MSKLLGTIVKLVVPFALLIVGYNYFLGDEQEKQNSKEIIGQVKTLTGSVVDLLKTEKEKYDKGKYDNAMEKLQSTFSVLKEKATTMGQSGEAALGKLSAMEQQRMDLQQKLEALESSGHSSGEIASRGGFDDSSEDAAELQESAESIRHEILRLNGEAESLALDLH